MKTLLTIFTLVFTLMFSSTSFAKWTKVIKAVDYSYFRWYEGDTFYVDFERIRKHDGYVYFWILVDHLTPKGNVSGAPTLSQTSYHQGDCKIFGVKQLTFSKHDEPMGRDTGYPYDHPDVEWGYPAPNSTMEVVLKSVCSH